MSTARLALDVNDALATQIGANGLTPADLEALEPAARAAHERLAQLRASGDLGFWTLPGDAAVRDPAIALGEELARRWENVVVLGIGGSSLGGKAVIAALGGPFHNLADRAHREGAGLRGAVDLEDRLSLIHI